MKHLRTLLTLYITFLVTCSDSNGQGAETSFLHRIETKGYEGLKFRLHAQIRAEIVDDSAAARIFAVVYKEKGVGFFDNMWFRPVRSNGWKEYSVEGRIDSAGVQMIFGVICSYNGKFFYDDIKLDVQNKNGRWTNIFSANFDNGENPLKQSGVDANFKASVVKEQNADKDYCLMIEGRDVPNYGMNNRVGKFADVNGIKLYYEIYGEGTPLIVLHGNGGSIASTSAFYPDLIKKYKVIAIDSRAHGKSGDTKADLTYEQMAADVNGLLEELKIDSVLVWGQSDGGILGLILAMDYPKKVKRVLAFGANIQPDSLAVYSWAITAVQKLLKTSTNPRSIKLNKLLAEQPNIPYSKLSSISAPVLLMVGDRDVIRPEHSVALFRNIPNSQLCILPGSTHGGARENKDIFLLMMDKFFTKPFTMPDTKNWFQ